MSIRNANEQNMDPGLTSVPDVPDTPTIGTASDVGTGRAYNNAAASITFTPAVTGGPAATYTATSTPGNLTGSGTSSPVTVTGLNSQTAYTFKVKGVNANAVNGVDSSASNSVTVTSVPQAPTLVSFTDNGTGAGGSLAFTANNTGGKLLTDYKWSSNGVTYTSASTTTSPFNISGLTPGTYTFTIKAVNANGDSAASNGVSGTVIQPTAFESIATATGTGSSSVTFSSIPSTYKNLQIRFSLLWSANGRATKFYFNGDTANNYASHVLYGNGTTASTSASVSSNGDYNMPGIASGGAYTTYPLVGVIDIQDYASTSKYKTARVFGGIDMNGAFTASIDLGSTLWMSTSAITSITIAGISSGTIASGSTFALYGIKG